MPIRNDFAPGEFCWIDLSAHDLKAAAAWYGELFGWSHQLMETPGGGPPYAFLISGNGVAGGLGQMNDEMKAQGIPPMWNSYVASEDCAATEAKVRELGGTVTVPTTEIPGHGKLAFFLDPEGAPIACWQNLNPNGDGMKVKEPVSLSWNELNTRDTEKASEFYGSLFGWNASTMPMGDIPYTMIKVGDADACGMFPMDGPQFEGVPAHWMVYFQVDDCDAVASKTQETGGQVIVPPTDIPVGRFSCLCDPQGAHFAVVTTK